MVAHHLGHRHTKKVLTVLQYPSGTHLFFWLLCKMRFQNFGHICHYIFMRCCWILQDLHKSVQLQPIQTLLRKTFATLHLVGLALYLYQKLPKTINPAPHHSSFPTHPTWPSWPHWPLCKKPPFSSLQRKLVLEQQQLERLAGTHNQQSIANIIENTSQIVVAKTWLKQKSSRNCISQNMAEKTNGYEKTNLKPTKAEQNNLAKLWLK